MKPFEVENSSKKEKKKKNDNRNLGSQNPRGGGFFPPS